MLCDGTNNTPDLRSRFVYGAGNGNTKTSWASGWNNVNGHWPAGQVGGEEMHQISITEMPNHTHTPNDSIFNEGGFDSSGNNKGLAQDGYPMRISIGDNQPYAGVVAYNSLSYTGGNQPHNILPRFMTLAYIMKL